MTGTLEILNCQAGDIKISFNKADPAEVIRAKRIIHDCLRRGYALLVEVERNGEKAYERAKGFDENTGEYLIADLDPVQAEATINDPEGKPVDPDRCACGRPANHRGRCAARRVPMEGTRAVAVPRSAGG